MKAPELTMKVNLPRGFRWMRKGEVTGGADYGVDLISMQWVGLDVGETVKKGDLFIRKRARRVVGKGGK